MQNDKVNLIQTVPPNPPESPPPPLNRRNQPWPRPDPRHRRRHHRHGDALVFAPLAWAKLMFFLHAGGTGEMFARRFIQLCRTADVAEAIAFYRGLPLYPDPQLLEAQAAEGTRTNMRAVFEAVAHRSPYPKEQFAENRWNHMVLKALFVGSTLHPIQGLDERANPTLARMLCDYAHERWAAGRPVSPELWRCVGPHADAEALGDLQRVLATGGATERKAAALAVAACPDAKAKELSAQTPDLAAAVASGELTWDSLRQAS